MTIRKVLERSDPQLVWLDLVQPTAEELDSVVRTYTLQPTAVKDCLEP